MDNLPEEFIETPINTNRYEDLGDMEEYPIRIPTYKVFNNDTGEIDDMPATMDEIDFNYAKETQKNGLNPNAFVGKVQVSPSISDEQLEEVIKLDKGKEVGWKVPYVPVEKEEKKEEKNESQRVNLIADTGGLLAYILTGDKKVSEVVKKDVERAENITAGSLVGAVGDKAKQIKFFTSGYYEYAKKQREFEKKGIVPAPFKNKEDYQRHLNELKEQALAIRNESDKYWSGLEELYKEEGLSKGEQAWAGFVRSSPDLAISLGAAYITKNPFAAVVVGGGLAYPAQYVETFDKAISQNLSYEQAFLSSQVAASTSATLNAIGDFAISKIAKIPQIKRIADKVKQASIEKVHSGKSISGKLPVARTSLQGAATEGLEELTEYSAVVGVEKAFGLNTDWNLEEALLSATIGGMAGGSAAGVGAIAYNKSITSLDEAIKKEIKRTNPDLDDTSTQKVANTISETFFQTGADKEFAGVMKSIIEKTNAPDVKPSSKQIKISQKTKQKIQKRYNISDEEMKTIEKVTNRAFEIRKGYNVALDHYSNLLSALGISDVEVATHSTMLASLTTASALRNGTSVEAEIERLGLNFNRRAEKQKYESDGKTLQRHKGGSKEISERVRVLEGEDTIKRMSNIIRKFTPNDDMRLLYDIKNNRWIMGESKDTNHQKMFLELYEDKTKAREEYNSRREDELQWKSPIEEEQREGIYGFIVQGYKGGDYLTRLKQVDEMYSTAYIIPKNSQEGVIVFARRPESITKTGLEEIIDGSTIVVDGIKTFIGNTRENTKGLYDKANKLISVFESGDASTFIHETTHAFERDLAENSQTPESKELLDEIYNQLGVKDGKPTNEQIEQWAKLNEAFFYTGKTPNRTMKQASENYHSWLKAIYNDIKELGVTPSKEVDKLIRKIYGGRQLDTVLDIGDQILQKQIKEKTVTKKDINNRIKKILDITKPRKQNGKLVGRFPDKAVNDFFDKTRKTLATKKDDAIIKITQNLIDIQDGMDEGLDVSDLIWENKLLSVASNKADLSLTAEVYNALSETYNEGKVGERVKREARKLHRNTIIKNAKEVLFQGKGKDWRTESSRTKQAIRRAGIFYQGWNGILDTLSMFDKSSKVGYSQLNRDLSVYQEETAMNTGIREDSEKLGELLSKALGTGKSTSRYINSTAKEKIKIEWGDNSKTFTREQLIDIYMKSKDPETKEIMEKDKVLQYNNEFLARVDEVLTDEDIKVADALFEFYRQNYEKVNKFYEDKYGISLGKNENYSPRSMQSQNIDVRNGDLRSGASVSSFKQRTAKGGQVQVKGAFRVFSDYITSTNHYIAFSDKLQDLNAVFSEAEIRNMIDNTFGKPMNRAIRYEIDRFATNNQKFLEIYDGVLSKIRSNYVVATLGAKPSIAIKQLVSFPAYLEKMSLSDFVAGVTEFAINPKKAMEILNESEYMKNRGFSVTQDFQKISKSETFKKFATQRGFRDFLMMNVELGDKGAIYIGGYALYRTEYNKNISRGMDEKSAKLKALDTVSRYTNATQQSSYMSEQSALQSNGFTNMLTLFQTAQNQYFRKEIGAIRGLATGRMSTKDAIKVLGIYHFLLPMLFQYVSDFGRWNWDNQKRAAILGSFNGAYVLSKVLESVADWVVTGKFRQNYTRLLDVVPVWTVIEEYQKMVEALSELDPEDMTLDDVGDVLVQSSKAAGYGFGVPMKYVTDVGTKLPEYIEKGEYLKAIGLTLGWTPWALEQ